MYIYNTPNSSFLCNEGHPLTEVGYALCRIWRRWGEWGTNTHFSRRNKCLFLKPFASFILLTYFSGSQKQRALPCLLPSKNMKQTNGRSLEPRLESRQRYVVFLVNVWHGGKGKHGAEVNLHYWYLFWLTSGFLYIGLRAVCKRTFCWEVKGLASGLRSVGNMVSAHIEGISLFLFPSFAFFSFDCFPLLVRSGC